MIKRLLPLVALAAIAVIIVRLASPDPTEVGSAISRPGPTSTSAPATATIPAPTIEPTSTTSPTPTPLPPAPVGQAGNWQLIFQDEFNANTLDQTHWTICYWWNDNGCTNNGNHESEWYTPDNVLLQDGFLRLRASKQSVEASDGKTYPYTSGIVTTGPATSTGQPGFDFQTGYAEIRARLPHGTGLWPAFWLLPTNTSVKREIDVMELLGDTPKTVRMHIHYFNTRGVEFGPGTSWTGPDFSADWHVFAIDWRSDRIIWLVDGVERWRYTNVRYVPATPMYLLLNLAVGGDWPGPPNSHTVFPSYFDIDYIRVWQAAG